MKSNLDSLFKTDKKLQEEGVDFVIRLADEEKGLEELSFRVRHFTPTNPRVKAAMAAYYKPYARQVEMETLPPEKDQEIRTKLFVDICLVSWKGVEIDGRPAEYSKDNAHKLFKALPELFDSLWKYAGNFVNYKEDVGNS